MATRRRPKAESSGDGGGFDSKEDRDRWQIAKHGQVRDGFRQEWEQTDDRPLLIYSEPFWESSEERSAWERAVAACPLSEYGELDAFVYLAEVGKVATGLRGGVPTIPRPRMTRRERDERLRALRKQAKAPGSDDDGGTV